MDRYAFIHVPKTAGSSIIKALNQILGPEAVAPRFDAHFDEINIERYSNYRMIVGHLRYDQLAHFPSRRILTYLRDPVDVIVSKYFFFRQMHSNTADSGAPQVRLCKELSLDEIVERQNEFKTLFNDSVWRFAAQGRHSYAMSENEALALACERLTAFDFVGIYEELADSVDFMSYTFNWPPVRNLPYENVTAERKALCALDSRTLKKLTNATLLDAEVYRVGRALFEQRKRSAWKKIILGPAFPVTHQPNSAGCLSSDSRFSLTEPTRGAEPGLIGKEASVIRVSIGFGGAVTARFRSGDSCEVKVFVMAHHLIADASLILRLVNKFGQVVYGTFTRHPLEPWGLSAGEVCEFIFRMPLDLAPGSYSFTIDLISGKVGGHSLLHYVNEASPFEILGSPNEPFLGTVNLRATMSKAMQSAFGCEYRIGERIDFTHRGTSGPYMLAGWSTPEEWACWTDGQTAELLLRLDNLPNESLELISTVHPYCPGAELKVGVVINGISCAEWCFSASGQTQEVRVVIPLESLTSKTLHVRFHIDRPVSPAQLGLSDDTRALGLAFRSMHIQSIVP